MPPLTIRLNPADNVGVLTTVNCSASAARFIKSGLPPIAANLALSRSSAAASITAGHLLLSSCYGRR
ncbi:MAG: hypothetical protein JO258_15905 [Alphaproteobacteria bacterium]|nr:hypothetical protein [Alphaproteobacteria bacterium]